MNKRVSSILRIVLLVFICLTGSVINDPAYAVTDNEYGNEEVGYCETFTQP